MAIQAVFFDFDGVLTLDASGSLTTNTFLGEYYGTPRREIDAYLKKYNDDLLLGAIEHRDIWQDVCGHFGWEPDMGVLKKAFEAATFELARGLVGLDYGAILFIDNTKANLEKPGELGMRTYHFDDSRRDVAALARHIETLL